MTKKSNVSRALGALAWFLAVLAIVLSFLDIWGPLYVVSLICGGVWVAVVLIGSIVGLAEVIAWCFRSAERPESPRD